MYNVEVSSDIQYLVTSIVDVNKQRRRVFVNYEPAFVLYNSEIRKYQIKVDSVIMSDIYNEIITILTKRAKIRAMALLKSHDYTEGRLREKLQANGYPKCCIDETVAYIYSYGYIDDRRFADNYIISRSSSKSRRVIETSLLKLGVSADIIKEACDEFYCEEDDYAKEINVIIGHINKKINSIDIKDYNQLQKLKASLYRKGFRLDDINKALDMVCDTNEY